MCVCVCVCVCGRLSNSVSHILLLILRSFMESTLCEAIIKFRNLLEIGLDYTDTMQVSLLARMILQILQLAEERCGL